MLTIDEFKQLEIEKKRLEIEDIVFPIVKDDSEGMEDLKLLMFGSNDDELVEFYEILLNPEKIGNYINKKGEEIKKGNIDIKNLNTQLNKAKLKMLEDLNHDDSDELLNQI